jgi:hypothetical protein
MIVENKSIFILRAFVSDSGGNQRFDSEQSFETEDEAKAAAEVLLMDDAFSGGRVYYFEQEVTLCSHEVADEPADAPEKE